jgi:hypothetical protein
VRIRNLYISPGHNFFGHHGQPPGTNPIVEVDQCDCVAGRGIRGDRFFGFKENYKGQITFFSWDVFEALRLHLNLQDVSPSLARRNVVVQNGDLNELVGREFEIQGVQFYGSAECTPCYWMDAAFGPGAEAFLKGRGGLRARILTSGALRVES